jgi:hypothetical protein
MVIRSTGINNHPLPPGDSNHEQLLVPPPPARGQGPGQAQGPGGCSEANFPELWIFDEPKKIFRPFIFLKNPLSHGFQSYFRRICKPDDPNNYRDMLFWSKCIPPWFTNVPLFQPKAKFFLDPSCPRTTPVGGHVFERVGKDPPPLVGGLSLLVLAHGGGRV